MLVGGVYGGLKMTEIGFPVNPSVRRLVQLELDLEK